jgi:hypothetical protein
VRCGKKKHSVTKTKALHYREVLEQRKHTATGDNTAVCFLLWVCYQLQADAMDGSTGNFGTQDQVPQT